MNAIIGSLFGSWRTTLVGALAAIANYFQGQPTDKGMIWSIVGSALLFLLGALAKDGNVTGGTKALNPPAP